MNQLPGNLLYFVRATVLGALILFAMLCGPLKATPHHYCNEKLQSSAQTANENIISFDNKDSSRIAI